LGGSRDKEERVPKKALKGYIEVRRTNGKPTQKWLDELDRGVKRKSKFSKRSSAKDRDAWRLGIEEAKLKLGSSAIREAEEEKEALNFLIVCRSSQ
jgi:hypothetical protein